MNNLLLRRGAAISFDYGIWFLFSWQYISIFGVPNEQGNLSVSGFPALVPIALWFLLFPVMTSIYGGSFGKLIMGLRVNTTAGNKPDGAQCFKRHCLDFFEIFMCLGIVATVTIMNTERNQRVGDLWAKTVVVTRKKSA